MIFDGERPPAIQAAYADQFPLIVAKLSQSGDIGMLAEKMTTLRDPFGNSLLDILGPHGRLNDILLPALWKDRDPCDVIPPCYREQCNFGALKAGIDQLKLKA